MVCGFVAGLWYYCFACFVYIFAVACCVNEVLFVGSYVLLALLVIMFGLICVGYFCDVVVVMFVWGVFVFALFVFSASDAACWWECLDARSGFYLDYLGFFLAVLVYLLDF